MPDCFRENRHETETRRENGDTVLFLHSLVVSYLILMPTLSLHAIYKSK